MRSPNTPHISPEGEKSPPVSGWFTFLPHPTSLGSLVYGPVTGPNTHGGGEDLHLETKPSVIFGLFGVYDVKVIFSFIQIFYYVLLFIQTLGYKYYD